MSNGRRLPPSLGGGGSGARLSGFTDEQSRALLAELAKLRAELSPRADRVLDRRKTGTIRPRPGDVVRANADDVVVLPHPRSAKGKAPVVVLVEAQPVTVLAESGTVNDAARVTVTTLGAMEWFSTGTEWWGSAVGGTSGGGGASGVIVTHNGDLVGTFTTIDFLDGCELNWVVTDQGDGVVQVSKQCPPDEPEGFYSSKVLNSDWQMVQSPSALYVASLDTTFVAWCAVGQAGDKASQVAAFDHATNTWSRRYNAGNYTLADDDHGHPAIVRDADGYLHIFYGSHDSDQHWSSTNAPDDITSWTQHAPMSGDQTYPHPVAVGSVLYLFLRNGDAFPDNATMSVRTCTPTSGTGTFTAQSDIVDFDDGVDGGRVYTGECHVVGTDVHFVATRSDEIDSKRSHVYYFVYKTATGAVENHDGSVSVASGSLPVDLTTANTSFRLIDFGTDGGEVPVLQFDTAGNPHVQYIQGTDGGGYTLRHITKSGGVWSSPTTVATIDDQVPGAGTGQGFCDMHGLVPGVSGTMQSWYQNAAGDKLRRTRSATGVWTSEETILAAGALRLMGQQAVRDAHPDFRALFSEVSTSSTDAGSVSGQRYGYGDSGPLNFAMAAAGSVDTQWPNVPIMLGFDHRDGSTRIINESDSAAVVTAQGNAQVDTAQFKFGSASLLLDGTGDYLSLVHNSLYSVSSGDFTVECWVRRNASKLQCVVAKKPSSGSSEWAMFINASNQLQCQAFDAVGVVVNITSAATIASATWTHVALSRSGTTWRQFVDGVLDGSATQSNTPLGNSQLLMIGRDNAFSARDFNGWIDDFRFTAGHARYTATFTAPTAAFSRI